MSSRNPSEKQKKNVDIVAKSLKSMIKKVEKQLDSPNKAYLTFAKELNATNAAVCKKDAAANPSLFSLLAAAADDIGNSMAALCKGAKAGDVETLTHGDTLSQATEQFGQILYTIGDSVNSECGFSNELQDQINQFREALSDTVQDYYLLSENLSNTLGDNALRIPLSYPILPPSSGCCGESGSVDENQFGVVETEPVFFSFDETALEYQIELLGEFLRRLLEILLLLALIFAVMPAIFCSSACAPIFTWMPVLISTIPATVVGGVQPSFTIQWDYCCQNTCFVWWTDEFVKTVTTITYAKGPVLRNNIVGRTRAVGLARRFGNTFVRNAGAAANPPLGGCAPVAAYPPAPVC